LKNELEVVRQEVLKIESLDKINRELQEKEIFLKTLLDEKEIKCNELRLERENY
jgi:hypothetical protein